MQDNAEINQVAIQINCRQRPSRKIQIDIEPQEEEKKILNYMGTFKITGGKKLKGAITPQGAKNETLQILCAVLLTPEEVRITNIPDIVDVNNSISDYFNSEIQNHQDKADLTIRNMLIMKSGIDYSNEVQTDELLSQIPDNSVEFILNRPINSPKGTEFHYNDGNPHLLPAMIHPLAANKTAELS